MKCTNCDGLGLITPHEVCPVCQGLGVIGESPAPVVEAPVKESKTSKVKKAVKKALKK